MPYLPLFAALVFSGVLVTILLWSRTSVKMAIDPPVKHSSKTVVILGAAYAGRRAVQVVAQFLPEDWDLVVVERNTHFNHVYVFPRCTVLSEHAPKAYVPYIHGYEQRVGEVMEPLPGQSVTYPGKRPDRLRWVHGNVVSLSRRSVTVKRLSGDHNVETVPFDFCIYALGATLPSPVDVWSPQSLYKAEGLKADGVRFMENKAEIYSKLNSLIVVGGGALGIQLATDTKSVHPHIDVTLIHSRSQLMPLYPEVMHREIVARMDELGIRVILGERVVEWPANPEFYDGTRKTIQTTSGTTLSAQLVLPCTGQSPRASLLGDIDPSCISPSNGRVKVKPTMQVSCTKGGVEGLDHIFATGDVADSGAIQAGHTAYFQGQTAAYNVLRLIEAEKTGEAAKLDTYAPGGPAIKVTLGLDKAIISNANGTHPAPAAPEDLHADVIWASHGCEGMPFDS